MTRHPCGDAEWAAPQVSLGERFWQEPCHGWDDKEIVSVDTEGTIDSPWETPTLRSCVEEEKPGGWEMELIL